MVDARTIRIDAIATRICALHLGYRIVAVTGRIGGRLELVFFTTFWSSL